MAREEYRVVVPTFWTDPEIKRKLTRDQKHLLLYYFTSPHSKGSLTGVYYCPIGYAAAEADLAMEDVRRWLDGPLAKHVTYDEETEEIFVHGFAKRNVGEELKIGDKGADNRIAAVRRQVQAIHSPRLKRLFLLKYGEAYRLDIPLPALVEGPYKGLPSPSEAIAVAVASHGISPHPSSDTTYPASAAMENPVGAGESEPPHTMQTVIGLVVEHLYFGERPPEAQMKINASVLKTLHVKRKLSWDELARAVIGLAERRNRGELKSVKSTDPVSCKWLHSQKPLLNQVGVSEDAYYRSGGADPPASKKRGGTTALADMDFIGRFAKGQPQAGVA